MNILVAEDEAIALKRSKYFLEKWGYNAITVQNGLEALEEFLSSNIDLVITDATGQLLFQLPSVMQHLAESICGSITVELFF